MRIESVDFFYLAMPEVLDIGDGSQDALLVRLLALEPRLEVPLHPPTEREALADLDAARAWV